MRAGGFPGNPGVNGRFRSRNSGQLVDHNILGVAWDQPSVKCRGGPRARRRGQGVRPALRGRSAATRLEGVEHTATMSGPTVPRSQPDVSGPQTQAMDGSGSCVHSAAIADPPVPILGCATAEGFTVPW